MMIIIAHTNCEKKFAREISVNIFTEEKNPREIFFCLLIRVHFKKKYVDDDAVFPNSLSVKSCIIKFLQTMDLNVFFLNLLLLLEDVIIFLLTHIELFKSTYVITLPT